MDTLFDVEGLLSGGRSFEHRSDRGEETRARLPEGVVALQEKNSRISGVRLAVIRGVFLTESLVSE